MQNQYSSFHKIKTLMALCMTNTRVFIWILEYWELKSLFEFVSMCSILEYSYQYSSLAHGEKLGVLYVRAILEYLMPILEYCSVKRIWAILCQVNTRVLNSILEFGSDSKFLKNLPKTNSKVCLQLLIIIKTPRELAACRAYTLTLPQNNQNNPYRYKEVVELPKAKN